MKTDRSVAMVKSLHKDLTCVDTYQTVAEETGAGALLLTHDPAAAQAVVDQFVFLS